jgi:hypothetical protein
MPKWAKADPDTIRTAAIANAATRFVFIYSSLYGFFGETDDFLRAHQAQKAKKKPRGTGAFLAPNLRGLSIYMVLLDGVEGFSLPLRELLCLIRERVNWKIAPATATAPAKLS